jgi:hypothetical protein
MAIANFQSMETPRHQTSKHWKSRGTLSARSIAVCPADLGRRDDSAMPLAFDRDGHYIPPLQIFG